MIAFVTWMLMILGATYAITCSFVAAPFRILFSRLGEVPRYFIYCGYCVAFWAGAISRFSTDPDWITTGFSMFAGGFMATGLVVVLKAAFPEALVPPFEAEQGARETEDAQETEQAEPLLAKCEHRWKTLGPDTRCVLCGMDKS